MKKCLEIIDYSQTYYLLHVSHGVDKINNYTLEVMDDWENHLSL